MCTQLQQCLIDAIKPKEGEKRQQCRQRIAIVVRLTSDKVREKLELQKREKTTKGKKGKATTHREGGS